VIVDDEHDLVAGLERALALSPADARDVAVRRFSSARMVDDYVNAFARLLSGV
jgi:hypothetical protein